MVERTTSILKAPSSGLESAGSVELARIPPSPPSHRDVPANSSPRPDGRGRSRRDGSLVSAEEDHLAIPHPHADAVLEHATPPLSLLR
ncbi:hypothetical protein CYV19_05630 [Natronobacterium gregoryi SP2]|uniref:Uncharacterized protein n=1 Tax=Natronobacterium gregoryi (strain ATCC 43098 / DSM 3393 / CCM 3738 / CIP 104747 / IAM 13177 / JCM 8860 / NBRC 102187 / NCIMB 2189 / SP2) TaxID=797304 RepID=L9Y5W4_NATGS|nr:hypothetical protein C490_08074 [Natronobacterium gregoryi SP2]PLK21113.1 hypothetical protein CYV19_05630 [Natronobacterium gregoryi SP2]